MGAIIGFPSPSVRPWQDLQRLLTPCLAQERGGGGTWPLGCRLTSGASHTLAGCWAHPSPSAPGSGRQDPAGGAQAAVLTACPAGLCPATLAAFQALCWVRGLRMQEGAGGPLPSELCPLHICSPHRGYK